MRPLLITVDRDQSAAMAASRKFDELESVRGIAALLVVLVHLPKFAGLLDGPAVRNLDLMVDLFFVLSGFVIFRSYAQRLNSAHDVARFQFLRFGRLYPVHLLFLLAYFVLELTKLYAASTQGVTLAAQPFSHNTLVRFVQNLFLVQALPPGSEVSFNSPSWSISVEFYTYLVFGVLVLVTGRWVLVVFAAIAAAALAALWTGNTASLEPLVRCWAGFFVGCLTAHGYKIWPQHQELPAATPALVVLALGLYVLFRPYKAGAVWIYMLSAALIVAVLCSRGNPVRSALRSRPLVILGTLSYSVYMAHHFLITVLEIVLNRVLRVPFVPKPSGGGIAMLTIGQAIIAYLVYFAVLFGVCALVYRCVEKPLREMTRRVVGTNFLPTGASTSPSGTTS